MWQRHWNLSRHPFDDRPSTFVATPTHLEAVARLAHAIESTARSSRLVAGPGLGKSMVLRRALEATRRPDRRVARVSGPLDASGLFAGLATGLGGRVASGFSRSTAWRALADAARVCRWQGLHVVLAVDDAHVLGGREGGLDWGRLVHLDPDPSARLTVLRVGRPSTGGADIPPSPEDWGIPIRLDPLTRSEAASYLALKLEAAGRAGPTFTPRACSRIHALARGIPGGLDRLATLALMASACRGLEIITPELVDEVARECPGATPSASVAWEPVDAGLAG